MELVREKVLSFPRAICWHSRPLPFPLWKDLFTFQSQVCSLSRAEEGQTWQQCLCQFLDESLWGCCPVIGAPPLPTQGHQTMGSQDVRNGVKMLCELTVASFASPENCLFPGNINKWMQIENIQIWFLATFLSPVACLFYFDVIFLSVEKIFVLKFCSWIAKSLVSDVMTYLDFSYSTFLPCFLLVLMSSSLVKFSLHQGFFFLPKCLPVCHSHYWIIILFGINWESSSLCNEFSYICRFLLYCFLFFSLSIIYVLVPYCFRCYIFLL